MNPIFSGCRSLLSEKNWTAYGYSVLLQANAESWQCVRHWCLHSLASHLARNPHFTS